MVRKLLSRLLVAAGLLAGSQAFAVTTIGGFAFDDNAFAAFWVEQRDTFRPRSRLALRQELSQKGLEREVVTEALDGLDEIEAARRVARKQAGRWHALPEVEWRTKLTRYLLRHGYPYDVVREVVNETWLALKPDQDS